MALGDSAAFRTILVRVGSNGNLGWVNGNTLVGAESLVSQADGSTFLAGHSTGWTTFWPGEVVSAGGWDLFAGRVAPGSALAWVRGTVAVLARSTESATFDAGEPGRSPSFRRCPAPPSWWWRVTGPERGGARGPGYRRFSASHQAFTPSATAAANLDANARGGGAVLPSP